MFKKLKKKATQAAKSVKRNASKAGRSVKRAGGSVRRGASKAGRGARSIGSSAASVAQETGNRVAGLPEAALNAAGVLPTKKLRLRVVVLADANGDPVLPAVGGDSTEERVMVVIDVAKEIFRDNARVKIVPAGGTFVTVDRKPAPAAALKVRCKGGAMKDELGEAGAYFRSRAVENRIGRITGNGAPIKAFVVADVIGTLGCSLGPLTDYVTVDVDGVARDETLAHEIGHALGLPHTGGGGRVVASSSPQNMMLSSGGGRHLNRRQVVLLRNSRHVTLR